MQTPSCELLIPLVLGTFGGGRKVKFGFVGGCQLPFKVIFKEVLSCELRLIHISRSS